MATTLDTIVAKFRKGSPNIAAAFDEVQRRLDALEGPPAPSPEFGADIRQPFPELGGHDKTVTTWSELQAALLVGGRIRVQGAITVPSTVANATVSHDDTHLWGTRADRIVGRVLVNASSVRVKGFEITGSPYDGVKIADGKSVSMVDLVDLWIHDVGGMGVLSGASPSADIWVRQSLIERLKLSGTSLQGHGIYTGGPTARWTIIANHIREANAFGLHLFPKVTDVLAAGNTVEARLCGSTVAWGNQKRIRLVGNLLSAPKGAFQWQPSAEDCFAYDNVAAGCPLDYEGYPPMPGEHNVRDADPKGFVQPAHWPLLPPVLVDGSPRVSPDAGA